MYNKIFAKILDSSIWLEATATRIVWLMFLAVMDEDGFAQFAAVANVAHRARVSLDEATAAVMCLQGPDLNSSDPANEGRRIERVPGGWMVLNAEKYRDIVTRENIKAQTRERVRKHRARQEEASAKEPCNAACNAPVTPSDTDIKEEDLIAPAQNAGAQARSAAVVVAKPGDLMELWNATTTKPIPRCRELTVLRSKKASARLRERPIAEWRDVIARIQASPFCRGDNDRGWTATFDWILQPDVATKILEGKYENHKPAAESTQEQWDRIKRGGGRIL